MLRIALCNGQHQGGHFLAYTIGMMNTVKYNPNMKHGNATRIVMKHAKESFGVGLIC